MGFSAYCEGSSRRRYESWIVRALKGVIVVCYEKHPFRCSLWRSARELISRWYAEGVGINGTRHGEPSYSS